MTPQTYAWEAPVLADFHHFELVIFLIFAAYSIVQTMLEIRETDDGSHTLFSEAYGSSYHSRFGAVQESKHVFIEHGLLYMAAQKKEIGILEMGFGTGLNAWLTLLEAARLGLQINYMAIELHPLEAAIVEKINYPTLSNQNPESFLEMHQAPWGARRTLSPNFELLKLQAPFEHWQPSDKYDLIYYDAFGPEVQPDLWGESMMEKMASALNPCGALVSFCAKGSFRRALMAVGLEVQRLPGPPGKREMTRGSNGWGFDVCDKSCTPVLVWKVGEV